MLLEFQKGGENGEEEDHSWGDQQYLEKLLKTYKCDNGNGNGNEL